MLDWRRGRVLGFWLTLAAGAGAGVSAAQEGGTAVEEAVDREEAARLQALKEARVDAILARAEARRPLDPASRAVIRARLAGASVDKLEALEKSASSSLRVDAVKGAPAGDPLLFVPVRPCRIVDTRAGGGPLVPGTERNFRVAGEDGFAAQGGTTGGCQVPFTAEAVAVNFVAVNPSGAGNLRAWAYGESSPAASIINYAAVGLNIANGVIVPMCTDVCLQEITVRADVSGTQLVADVMGYFTHHYPSRVVTAVSAASAPIPPIACTNAGSVAVTMATSAPGRIVVRGSANLRVLHLNGTAEDIWTAIGATPTDCPGTDFGRSVIVTRIPAAFPTFNSTSGNSFVFQVSPMRVFTVEPGVHTYYLNFIQLGGAGDDSMLYGSLEATFHPF